MKKETLKKVAAATLSSAIVLAPMTVMGAESEAAGLTLDQITLGEDYTDVEADLKFLTHRTDIVDTDLAQYAEDFKKDYPNVNIEFEAITDYVNDITMRLTTGDWGDICMIPTSVDKAELGNYFMSLGTVEGLSGNYQENLIQNFLYDGNVYGVPSMANVQGIVYNKAVFEAAGVTEIPKTPDEFLDALQKIKDNTDAIPMYTNFAAGWTMTAWDAYIDGGATGDANFAHEGLTKGENPFSDRGDATGPYAVYNTLYEAVSRGLTEEDPTTTDWEGSKGMLNRGEIGCMALGSWAIVQMQQAGENADDIGYMAFPITVDGKQYAAAGPDYNYGININSSDDDKAAAMCFVKYMVEKSDYAAKAGGLSAVIGAEMPDALAAMDGVELVVNSTAPAGEENLFNDINNESELGLNVSGYTSSTIVESAISGSATMEELVTDWNERWTAAQEENGVTHE